MKAENYRGITLMNTSYKILVEKIKDGIDIKIKREREREKIRPHSTLLKWVPRDSENECRIYGMQE